MKKTLLLAFAVFFFARCNQQPDQKADNIDFKSVISESVMQQFNAAPAPKSYYAKFEAKDNNIPRPQSAAILGLLKDMQAQPQRFTIQAGEQNEVQGEYGTKISIPGNCFTHKDGKEVSTAVEIELKECYTLGEMLEENLTTASNKQVMESKGAVFVSATCNGEQLQMKEGQEVHVDFPFAVNSRGSYHFYYGIPGESNMEWIPAGGDEEGAGEKTKVYKPEFSFKGYSLTDYLAAQLEYPEDAKRNELSSKVEVTFVVDKYGKVRDISCISDYKTFRDEIVTALEAMPKWKPAAYGKKKISAQVKLNVDFNLRRKEQVLVDYNDSNISPIGTGKKTDIDAQDAIYSKSFDQLGWISYSRFTNYTAAKADVIVSDDANSDVRIVIKGKNSIVRGATCVGYTRFNMLPVAANAYVVAVRYEKGDVFYSIQPVRLDKQTVVTLQWKKASEAEIEEAFRKINVAV